jgi:hypothetical protein
MDNLGDVLVDSTIHINFDTHGANGERIAFDATIEAADFRIYKDGSATQRASQAGWTVSETFDSMVGMHQLEIDLSDNTDAGFYAAGSSYKVALYPDETINSQAVAKWIGSFRIEGVAIAKTVWDRVLTAATHNISTSAGRRLRELAGNVIHADTAQSGSTTNTIVLASAASSTDGMYDPSLIAIVGGTGSGQSRMILEYAGSTRTAVVDRDWKTTPDNTSEYVIYANPGREHVNEGMAQGGTSNTITLNALASASDDVYNGQLIFIKSGTGSDQVGLVTDYNGTTKVATIITATNGWDVTPDSTSAYIMIPTMVHTLAQINAEVLDVIATDTFALAAQGAPSKTPTIKDALLMLYKALVNQTTQSNTQFRIYNAAADTVDHQSTDSDDGTTRTSGDLGSGA